jgi:diguanylate cyclase (GGDEF)-like protein
LPPPLYGLVQSRIGRRLALVVGLSMALVGGGGLSWLFQRTAAAHEDSVRQVLEVMAVGIAGSFTHYDSRLGGHAITEIAAELAPEARSADLDVFDHGGTIRWSSDSARVGRPIAAAVLARVRSSSAAALPQSATQHVMALPKRASCLPCHDKSADPIGGLLITADAQRLLGGRVDLETVAAVSLVLVVLALTALVLFVMNRTVIAPLSRLAQVMSQVEEGDFFARAEVRTQDEIGLLASSFNKLIAKITDLRVERIDTERELRGVRGELELKAELAAKSRDLEERLEQLGFLYALSRELSRELDPDPLLERLCELVVSKLGVPELSVLLFTEGGYARVAASAGFPPDTVELTRSFKLDGSVSAEAALSRAPVYVPDLSRDTRRISYRTQRGDRGSLVCVPVIYQERVLGTLNFSSPERDAFTPTRQELLVAAANQAALALANAQLFRTTLELSRTDGLTGIPNRRALETRLEVEWAARERHGGALSVVVIDIDHFKVYNDTHGHPQGDEVLRRVAHLLETSVRRSDGLARYGGEEFVVVLPRTDRAQAAAVAEKLRRSIEQADFERGHHQPLGRITISCGVATAPEDGGSIVELVHAADEALFAAKNAGRNAVRVAGAPAAPAQPRSASTTAASSDDAEDSADDDGDAR